MEEEETEPRDCPGPGTLGSVLRKEKFPPREEFCQEKVAEGGCWANQTKD